MTSRNRTTEEAHRTEVETRTGWSLAARAIVSATILSVGLLGATLACRADEPAAKIQEPEPILVELDTPDRGAPPNIKPIRIQRGETVQINSTSKTVWITIPSRYFLQAGGGSDWAVGDEMIAVKIDHGFARVKLSEDFPAPKEEQSVFFSILYFDGEEYYYQHGESPPRMIIPPTGP